MTDTTTETTGRETVTDGTAKARFIAAMRAVAPEIYTAGYLKKVMTKTDWIERTWQDLREFRKMSLVLLLLLLAVPSAWSLPYFRLLDTSHPQVSAGAFVDPGSGVTSYGSMLALVTHHPRDGMIIKDVPAEWTLLAVGGGYGQGSGFMAAGPSVNVAPVAKAIVYKLLDAITKEDRYLSLKSLFSGGVGEGPDITGAFGPSLFFNVLEGGAFVPVDRYRAQFRVFVGASWHF